MTDFGDLNIVEPKPNMELSWQPKDTPKYTVCAISLGMYVSTLHGDV